MFMCPSLNHNILGNLDKYTTASIHKAAHNIMKISVKPKTKKLKQNIYCHSRLGLVVHYCSL